MRSDVGAEVVPEPLSVDELFRKTKAEPAVYYLPLSDDEIAKRASAKAGDGDAMLK
jgi:hypothetical protein